MFKAILSIITIAVIMVGLIYAVLIAMVHETEINDNIRKERCARLGEHIPPALETYCNNIGV